MFEILQSNVGTRPAAVPRVRTISSATVSRTSCRDKGNTVRAYRNASFWNIFTVLLF